MTVRIAVLASGGGSNLAALLDYFDRPPGGEDHAVTAVISDRRSAGALDRARRRQIATATIDADDGGASLGAALDHHTADLVVLAGYLRIVPVDVVRRYRGRMLNVHPALLPAFGGPGMYGMRVHRAVLAAGVRITGVTVHFVDEEYDRGPVVAQWPVPVHVGDTPEALAARVLRVEHVLLPRAVSAVAAGRIRLGGGSTALGVTAEAPDDAFVLQPTVDHALARAIDVLLAR